MPTSWNELSSFYLILGIIGIPLLLGFLTEAGKDIYSKVTKKPTPETFYTRCRETQAQCQKELAAMHALDTFMLNRQTVLREQTLKELEITMTEIKSELKYIREMLEEKN